MLMKWRRKDLLRKMYKIMLVEELTTRSKWLKRELDSLYEYCIQYLLNKYFHFKVTLYNTVTCQSYCYMFSQYLRGSLKSFKIQLPKLKILARIASNFIPSINWEDKMVFAFMYELQSALEGPFLPINTFNKKVSITK